MHGQGTPQLLLAAHLQHPRWQRHLELRAICCCVPHIGTARVEAQHDLHAEGGQPSSPACGDEPQAPKRSHRAPGLSVQTASRPPAAVYSLSNCTSEAHRVPRRPTVKKAERKPPSYSIVIPAGTQKRRAGAEARTQTSTATPCTPLEASWCRAGANQGAVRHENMPSWFTCTRPGTRERFLPDSHHAHCPHGGGKAREKTDRALRLHPQHTHAPSPAAASPRL